jgi:EAL domain-containing protein (putative c-di-GMP-specific phosphodiesterase class I)
LIRDVDFHASQSINGWIAVMRGDVGAAHNLVPPKAGSAKMNMNHSHKYPSRECSSNGFSRASVDSLAVFERPVARDWLLEGEMTSSGEPSYVFINTTPFQVGRRSSCNHTIPNRTVSGRHAELIVDNGNLLLKDHNSTNGTFLNGKRVRSFMPVADGDVIHFGKVRFHVRGNRESIPRATLAFDAEGDALAHLQFASLWDGDALTPHFQPIVRLADQKVIAFESLARSALPGLDNPYLMFQIAKQHKAESELSALLRQVSLERAAPLYGDYEFFLNTHPAEIGSTDLFDSLEELREEFPEAMIVVEVHEAGNVSIAYLEELKLKLTELDMKLAYDDFGRGQSRLNALAEVTPDIVKFDMELVHGLHEASPKRRRFVRSLLKIVKSLNGLTLAEGVEEAEEAEVCLELGFELAQGYYYGRPQTIATWLDNHAPLEDTH